MIELDVTTLERPDGDVAVVAVRGRLNLVAARTLRATFADLAGAGRSRIVVDLAETVFIDSTGLGALIGGVKTARQAGGDLRIARPTESVLAVLKLTNLDRVLRPRDSVDGAFDA